jgi:uncharacterized protein (TIRG00374 family)
MKARASLIALVLAVGALVVVGYQLDWRAVFSAWERVAWPWVIVAALVNILNTWVEGLRWQTVLRASDIRVPAKTTFSSMLVGTVGNVVLPFKLGEAARAWSLARLAGAPMSTVGSTVLLDRIIDACTVVPLLLCVPLAGGSIGVPTPGARTVLIAIVVAGTVIALGMAGWRRLHARHGEGSGSRFAPHLKSFTRGLATLRQRHALARAGAFGLLSWCLRSCVVWAMFPAFGLDWSPLRAVLTLLGINLSIVVVATPGNVGTFELAGAGLVHYFGAASEIAVSYAVALHLAEVVPTVTLGAIAIWRLGLRFDRAASLTDPPRES